MLLYLDNEVKIIGPEIIVNKTKIMKLLKNGENFKVLEVSMYEKIKDFVPRCNIMHEEWLS